MKNTIIKIFFVGVFAAGISVTASAGPLDSLLGQLKNGQNFVCRAGSALDFRFSIRSGKGVACKNKVVAGIAELLCKNAEGYQTSHCHDNADKVLKGQDPKMAIFDGLKDLGGTAIGLVCGANIPALSSVCGMLKKKPETKMIKAAPEMDPELD